MIRLAKVLGVVMLVGGLTVACGDTGTMEPGSVLTIRFQGVSSGGGGTLGQGGGASVNIAGTNGTLMLDDLRLVVSEFELERTNVPDDDDGDDDDNGAGGDENSDEFEAPPAFVQLPLIDGEVPVVQQAVPAGVYSEFEFEIENLEENIGDDDFDDLVTLLTQVREEFPDWPTEASMLATGSFTPTDGTPVSFTVYFEAEISIEMEFNPPLIVEADAVGATVDITVDPRLWFLRGDGTVTDLSQFDFATTGELVELEFEWEDGFTEIEFDG